MSDFLSPQFLDHLQRKGIQLLKFLVRRVYLLLILPIAFGLYSYMKAKKVRPTYTSTISFVLSTEQGTPRNFAGLAAQLGIDATVAGTENIFSGDNIVELVKSKLIIRKALLRPIPDGTESLANYLGAALYPQKKALLPFPGDTTKFSPAQVRLFRAIGDQVRNSFILFKKDKKLIFYYMSATSTNERAAFYIAKVVLEQTAQYFIETKTAVASAGLTLLRKEADSLAAVLNGTFRSSLNLADRTFNINPSVTIQRSSGQFTQAKSAALSAAYTEVMRNLEAAKINVQRETPLYRIIDEPDLPLSPQRPSAIGAAYRSAIKGFLLNLVLVSMLWAAINYRDILTIQK